ncbi:MAG TPA: dienelactone hydrolase family protein [Bacteroidota bacterium]|nr:dienelactone hydrolase family protein [Bacteroidota bacterium]HUI64488.1 dienelactone hydrolase family protein [Bacteroidota bacterium]
MKLLPACLLVFLPATLVAQSSNCCSASATQQFALFANDDNFVASHPDPLPFHLSAERGAWVHFKTADSLDGRAYEVKASKATNNYLIVVQEWWGVNDYILRMADSLQEELKNVNVLAVDLYDGKVASTREEAGKIMAGLKEERGHAILDGLMKYIGSSARIGTIGWCMGGGWSMQAALAAGKRTVACVMFYGMPEKDLGRIKSLNGPVLFVFAMKDRWINQAVVDQFQKDMKEAGKSLTVKSYDADHGFANPSNPVFDKPATEDSYSHAVEFLRKNLASK